MRVGVVWLLRHEVTVVVPVVRGGIWVVVEESRSHLLSHHGFHCVLRCYRSGVLTDQPGCFLSVKMLLL